ncbi:putative ubiquitin-conjugating enzyme E2 38 [Hibiscus syriacus]|uniref:putative ubiquitin-conjugating enzyme E2 38 n=1 Tax=Hibiscus syriacus TaxID=106335 RepID=UPI0019223502|nr:putative ubiquitin-conjugating enzyme E2 38 [Hibiscus syriacus]
MASSRKELVRSKKLKRFDCVTDFSDHYYYLRSESKQKKKCIDYDKTTVKRITREWGILQNNLPESIFVRVYEGRIDLLRAAIIGARNTPYHNGIFVFDLKFPHDYPRYPPKVTYRSFGFRLNPNLYESGYVCLSLLNTWDGKETERWSPKISTVLQVLLSLQGLVLNEKPYFNEPGIKPAWSWQSYNADVFVLSCKTMLCLLRRPAKNFESFIAWHFRVNGRVILRACVDYVEGRARVGFFNGDVEGDHVPVCSTKKIKVSKKFSDAIVELYPQLYKAFNGVGALLTDLPEKIIVPETERPASSGILGKLKTFWKTITA